MKEEAINIGLTRAHNTVGGDAMHWIGRCRLASAFLAFLAVLVPDANVIERWFIHRLERAILRWQVKHCKHGEVR